MAKREKNGNYKILQGLKLNGPKKKKNRQIIFKVTISSVCIIAESLSKQNQIEELVNSDFTQGRGKKL